MLVDWQRITMILVAILLTVCSSALASNPVKCYTCDNICGPSNKTWNVTQCSSGSCRIEFMKLPGDSNCIGPRAEGSKRTLAASGRR